MEFFDETLASAAVEKPALNGVVAEEEQVPITHPAKSHAAVAAENPTPISSVANGEGEGVPGAHTAAKSYAAVAVLAEIAALRAAKLDLEAKLDEARRENKFLAEETHRIEGIFPQVRAEATIAAATSAEEIAVLRTKVDRFKTEKGEHELDKQSHDKLAKEVDAVRQEKHKLEEEIRALKASATAAVAAEKPTPISSVANGEGVPGAHTAGKSYAAVAVLAEIAALRAAKLDLEAKLDEARRENKFLAEETHRIEGIFPQVRAEATIAAATSAEEIASLRMKVDRLKTEKGEHELDMQSHDKLAKEVDALRQEKLKLEEEIRALKASTTAAATKEREAAPAAEAPKEGEVAWMGLVVAAAAGVASMAAVMLICLHRKR
ncbi:uncharacterized protein LOC100276736 [Zea mays]|uniref:uncharacterized protein LOC100276736 n=1 Tax=Zea mays TaxID=4577 RepID=UPI00076F40D3|nr:uncharacterized protein LOC100276736 [Zea mays]|eukprot:NP_001307215.1 uncharacterized protein LOC100276736 [Zea mays]